MSLCKNRNVIIAKTNKNNPIEFQVFHFFQKTVLKELWNISAYQKHNLCIYFVIYLILYLYMIHGFHITLFEYRNLN